MDLSKLERFVKHKPELPLQYTNSHFQSSRALGEFSLRHYLTQTPPSDRAWGRCLTHLLRCLSTAKVLTLYSLANRNQKHKSNFCNLNINNNEHIYTHCFSSESKCTRTTLDNQRCCSSTQANTTDTTHRRKRNRI